MVAMAVRRLIVEVVAAKGLVAKDGPPDAPTSNAYCVLDYSGQGKRTRVKAKDLNPTWNEKSSRDDVNLEFGNFVNHLWNLEFEFVITEIHIPGDLEINVYSERNPLEFTGRRGSFLGRVRVPISNVPERTDVIRWYPLQKRKSGLFSHITGDLGLRIWWQEAERSSQDRFDKEIGGGGGRRPDSQPDSRIRPTARTETSDSSLRNFQSQWITEENETEFNRGYESNGSIEAVTVTVPSSAPDFRRVSERFMEGEGSNRTSRSASDLARSDLSYNSHDLDDPINTANMLKSIESEIENSLNERMVAREAHLEKVKDLEDANHSRFVEAFEYSSNTEWSIQEKSPICGAQLVAQSLQRTQSMVASKQTLENFRIPVNLIPRIDDAMDNEKQLVMSVTKTARDAGEQQRQLCDIEQNGYQTYLALIEKQNKERMELFKTVQQEKEHHLKLWAVSRRDTLDIVQSIESNSQPLLERLNILVETTRKQAEVIRVLGGEATEEASNASKSQCQICFDYIEGPSSQRVRTSETRDLQQRSCLIPCNHAMICLTCATEIWESTKSCPFCKMTLTTKPRALYLG